MNKKRVELYKKEVIRIAKTILPELHVESRKDNIPNLMNDIAIQAFRMGEDWNVKDYDHWLIQLGFEHLDEHGCLPELPE